jgi:hypothetical protein
MVPLLGLALTADSREGAILQLRIAAQQAELLLSEELDDGLEPAPVFRP